MTTVTFHDQTATGKPVASLLAGDRQVEDLDETIDLTTDPDLIFIKLVPLAGG
jgi:hypothetical protein